MLPLSSCERRPAPNTSSASGAPFTPARTPKSDAASRRASPAAAPTFGLAPAACIAMVLCENQDIQLIGGASGLSLHLLVGGLNAGRFA